MTGRCGNAPNWYVAEVRPALRVLKVPSQSPSHMVFGCGRGSTRFEGTESLNDLYGLSELEVVAEVRPALRVLKAASPGATPAQAARGRGSTRFEGTER